MAECSLSSFDEGLTEVADPEGGSVRVANLEVNDRVTMDKDNKSKDVTEGEDGQLTFRR
jgi:hypothetical protein